MAKALAQGLGGKVKESLEKAIALSPKHADARIALGAFHAEVIDKVGPADWRHDLWRQEGHGLKLFPGSAQAQPGLGHCDDRVRQRPRHAGGDKKMKEATALYEKAATAEPMDAMERLDVEMARSELEEE